MITDPYRSVTPSSLVEYLAEQPDGPTLDEWVMLDQAIAKQSAWPKMLRDQVKTLAAKIPMSLHGIIQLAILRDNAGELLLGGLTTQPDEALEQMSSFYELAGNRSPRQVPHDARSKLLIGDELDAVLQADDNQMPEPSGDMVALRSSVSMSGYEREKTVADGETVASYKLNEALALPMSYQDKRMCQKIAAAIPASIQGTFMLDVAYDSTAEPANYRPLCLSIDGNLSVEEFNQTLFKPLIDKSIKRDGPLRHPVIVQKLMREELQQLAEQLPAISRQRH